MNYHGIEIDTARDSRLSEQAMQLLQDYYLLTEERSPQEAFARAAVAYSAGDRGLAQRVYDYASKGWFMYASPVLSNAPKQGEKPKALPISCFLTYVGDNLDNQIGQEVLNGLYFEGRENPDKTLDELRKIVAKNLAKDGQYYMKNAAFGVKGLGYQETKMKEVTGKYAPSGYSEKLKEMVKESLIREEELPTTPVEKRPFVSAEKLKQVLQVVKKIQLKGSDPMSTTEIGNESDLMRFLLGLRFKQVRPGVYHLEGPNDSTVTMGKGSLDEASDFEEKMAQLRMLQMQKKQGVAPDQKVINKKQTLTQKLNMLKKAYFDLISAMEKETDLEFAVSGDWYQEQLDDLENSIGDLETKIQSLNENAIGEEVEITAEVENVEEAEPAAASSAGCG